MNAWSREDIIVAYALYCVTPLKKINPSNKVIQQVAEIIPHSVASIVMRMRNFQYIDPQVSAGLRNVAKADRMIYEEFKHDWGDLSLEAETLTGLDIFDSSPLQGAKPLSSLTDHGKVSRERHFFKKAVLATYDNRCFISGCALPQMLVASHIKPYSQCRSEADRVSPDNGICLNTFYDKAFDRGLITITPSMKLYVSPVILNAPQDDFTARWLTSLDGTVLPLPPDFRRVESFWSTTTTKFLRGRQKVDERRNLCPLFCRPETDRPEYRRAA